MREFFITENFLKDEERKYLIKVDSFIKYYKADLLTASENNAKLRKNLMFNVEKNHFEEISRSTLCTLFILYNRDVAINRNSIESYMKTLFGIYPKSWFDKTTIRCFFSQLDFNPEESAPKYEEGVSYLKKTIFEVEDFIQFANLYRYQRWSWTESALMSIWFINKFF